MGIRREKVIAAKIARQNPGRLFKHARRQLARRNFDCEKANFQFLRFVGVLMAGTADFDGLLQDCAKLLAQLTC